MIPATLNLLEPDGSQRELLIVRLMCHGSTVERLGALTAAQGFDGVEVLAYVSDHPYVTDGPMEPLTVVLELDWQFPHDADKIAHAIGQELEQHGAHLLGYARTYRTEAHIMDGHAKPENERHGREGLS